MYGYGRPSAYQANQVNTVNKNKLVVMLYDGAIRFVKEARQRAITGDVPGRGLFISKSQKIVMELMNSLNHDKGGEVAKGLNSMYMEANRLLTNANITGQTADLDTVEEMLVDVREAWTKVIGAAGLAPAAQAPVATPVLQTAPVSSSNANAGAAARFAYRA
jgi:flagellar protein FliS